MAINVNREVEDAFYRYKMPKLAAKVEGKGNGIKTVIVNVGDIAKSLCRNPMYVTKFFGFELGAQIHVDGKNERYIVNGAHDATKLQELLDGFIKKFVLCESCGNPETTMCVNKRAGTVATTCKACGCQGQLDVKHRLTQYIIKNEGDTAVKVKSKKNKKGKNAEKVSDEEQEASLIGDDVNRQSPTNTMDDDDDEWVEDTTEEAQLKRMNELSAMAKSLALSVDVEKSETERADILYKHLKQLIHAGQILSRTREVYQEADRLNLGSRAVLVLAEVLLTSPAEIVADIKKYSPIFVQFTRFGDSQKRSQQYLLGAMCKLVERHSDTNLISKACHMLKAFYDCDIIEEDTILEWNDKGPSKKFVSKELCANILATCAPMINWLKEAEEETDESDEEEPERMQSIVSQTHENGSKLIPDAQTNGSKESESEDDIDIDAI